MKKSEQIGATLVMKVSSIDCQNHRGRRGLLVYSRHIQDSTVALVHILIEIGIVNT